MNTQNNLSSQNIYTATSLLSHLAHVPTGNNLKCGCSVYVVHSIQWRYLSRLRELLACSHCPTLSFSVPHLLMCIGSGKRWAFFPPLVTAKQTLRFSNRIFIILLAVWFAQLKYSEYYERFCGRADRVASGHQLIDPEIQSSANSVSKLYVSFGESVELAIA